MRESNSHQVEVEKLLETLSKHRSLISRGYSSKREAEFYPDEEPVIQLLRSQGLVRPVGDGQFRLSKQLRDLINRGVNRHHIRDINVNLGQYVDSLELSINDYFSALNRKAEGDIENAADELVSVFYEIGDFFSDASIEIDQQVKLVIGNHTYGSERVRVIKAYLAKLDRLQEAYESISSLLEGEIYQHDHFLNLESVKFKRRALRYIDQVKSTHHEIKSVLHMREVRERRTQTLRQLDAFLRENPTAEFYKAQEAAFKSPFFMAASPIAVQSFIDTQSTDEDWNKVYESMVISIASKKPVPAEKYSRPESGPTRSELIAREREHIVAIDMINEIIRSVFKTTGSISVVDFRMNHELGGRVSAPYWLYITRIHMMSIMLSPNSKLRRYFRVTPIFNQSELNLGNRTVRDVIISHRDYIDKNLPKVKAGGGVISYV